MSSCAFLILAAALVAQLMPLVNQKFLRNGRVNLGIFTGCVIMVT